MDYFERRQRHHHWTCHQQRLYLHVVVAAAAAGAVEKVIAADRFVAAAAVAALGLFEKAPRQLPASSCLEVVAMQTSCRRSWPCKLWTSQHGYHKRRRSKKIGTRRVYLWTCRGRGLEFYICFVQQHERHTNQQTMIRVYACMREGMQMDSTYLSVIAGRGRGPDGQY